MVISMEKNQLRKSKHELINRILNLIKKFEKFEVCHNQILILGSLDYFRLALKRENLENKEKYELLLTIKDYVNFIAGYEYHENFSKMDLSQIDRKFDELQDYISDLGVLPRLYDEDVDLNVFLEQ